MHSPRRLQVLDALGIERWQLRSGSPAAVAEAVVEAAAPPPPAPAAGLAPAAPPPMPAAPPKPRPAPVAAEAPAGKPLIEVPADWDGLRAVVKDCRQCKLCQTRTQTVFGVGIESAPLMVVGEGPGADEDIQGQPFVGRAGKLLDEMLKAIGHSRRDNTYIANVVKCRPPGNRDPETDEVESCRPYLEQQIRLVKPRLIVGLGRIAAQRLLNSDAPLSRLRGPLHHYGPEQTPLFITYHPAYLLRSPREKAKSWEDLKKIHQFLNPKP
ncbi:uracil-DNA glycosylase [Solimonas sp. K1W22B-7]|uniref:uracil-DNA glycosylase n=1 Tax=Solimonas sp. K1W22B-7 TaxID=2303331 RepID=UPI000E33319C|nr:uracil-DNA glycosylase [Solimonas sp. K1W22B-7]AXQ31734.1 uracil-DNA glycosylase [Solimonas sp. K1W22B-7]